VTKRKTYIGVCQNDDGSWQFTVQKENGKLKIGIGHTTAKVAALMRDEYILRQGLDQKRNFPVKRISRMRNDAYEQMFGKDE
jgi:hypothetical protein